MTQSLHPIDERMIAKVVLENVSRIPRVEVPSREKADVSTVGPGWRVWGVGVHRVAGALNIEINLTVTLDQKNSIPSLSTRVRRKVRTAIQSLTAEEIRWINLRILDVLLKD